MKGIRRWNLDWCGEPCGRTGVRVGTVGSVTLDCVAKSSRLRQRLNAKTQVLTYTATYNLESVCDDLETGVEVVYILDDVVVRRLHGFSARVSEWQER